MRDGDEVRDHLRKFFDAVDKLMDMEVNIHPDLLTIILLYSLPPCFENFRCAIESRDELPTPEALRIKIVEEYDARKNDSHTVVTDAMAAAKYYKKSHFQKTENHNRFIPRTEVKIRCFKCHKLGHKANKCSSGINKFAAKNVENNTLLAQTTLTERTSALRADNLVNGRRWCLDSGCSSHLSNNADDFVKITNTDTGKLNLANKETTNIEACGDATVKIKVKGHNENVIIQNALLVPDLRTNLLSWKDY